MEGGSFGLITPGMGTLLYRQDAEDAFELVQSSAVDEEFAAKTSLTDAVSTRT